MCYIYQGTLAKKRKKSGMRRREKKKKGEGEEDELRAALLSFEVDHGKDCAALDTICQKQERSMSVGSPQREEKRMKKKKECCAQSSVINWPVR